MQLLTRNVLQSLMIVGFVFVLMTAFNSKVKPKSNSLAGEKPRIIISTDIGGSDPDDFQSMIHFLMYADQFQTEGLISSPFYFDEGSKKDILKIIDLYEKDYPKLKKHGDYPGAESLRKVTKQGNTSKIPLYNGWNLPSEGSEWIIRQANKESDQPLWILVWGGLGDVAQALHDAPEIAEKIRVYWIGGPNKKWGVHPYVYIAQNFPDLWMIENNSTYRGWIIDSDAEEEFKKEKFFKKYIDNRGALGTDFGNYYEGAIKMGDTPSLAYLLDGDADKPSTESWGGSFTKLPYSSIRKFNRNTTSSDTISTYSVIEWTFKQETDDLQKKHEIWMEIDNQRIEGFYMGNGEYKVRFVPKKIGNWKYELNSSVEKLDGLTGEFISANPWPGKRHPDNIPLNNWWSDKSDADLYIGEYQGAKTISKWRETFLLDWAKRMKWLQ